MPYDSAFGQMMHNVFGGFDYAVFSAFGAIQNDIFTFLAKVLTCFGQPIFGIMLGFFALILCCFKRTRKIGALVALALLLFLLLNDIILKNLLLRLRPYNVLQGDSQYLVWYMNAGAIAEGPYCFPSGHTCLNFAVATVLFFWLKKDKNKSWGWIFYVFAAFVASSRIYLMLHFATDVIFALIEGILIGLLVWYGVTFFANNLGKMPKFIQKLFDIDAENLFSKKTGREINTNLACTIIVLVVLGLWLTTFIQYNNQIAKQIRCQHEGLDYICMNEATTKTFNDQTNKWEFHCKEHK